MEANIFLIFLIGSVFFVFLSRKSILKPKSHGFFRFFVFEFLLAQLLIDLNNPVAPHESVALRLLTDFCFNAALLLAAIGFWTLKKRGSPDSSRNDIPMLEFEKTTEVICNGIYRYIRHPMYSALLLLSWGFFLKQLSPITTLLALASSLFLIATARIEEQENINYFGAKYFEYMQRTKMFIPFIF
jgi:protein-S-isoprenylcysteine O-methyltransferase Ste14